MIICSTVPLLAIAQNSPSCGDQHTDRHWTALGLVREVHVIPSGLVMIPPLYDTAQNRPRSGDQHTLLHPLTGAVRAVHVFPSGLVMTIWAAVPLFATAQNSPRSGDQHTLAQNTALGDVRDVQARVQS